MLQEVRQLNISRQIKVIIQSAKQKNRRNSYAEFFKIIDFYEDLGILLKTPYKLIHKQSLISQ